MHQVFPTASDPVERLADWVEMETITRRTKQFSLESFVRLIRRSGGYDAFDDSGADPGSELSQSIASDVFAEVERRVIACGHAGAYPFSVGSGLLEALSGWEHTPYALLLLFSQSPPTTGYKGTSVLFELLCAHAAGQYFGGPGNHAASLRFGSPRRVPFAKLSQAVDRLCVVLAEGSGCRQPSKAAHTGDDGLDVVAWRHFPDRRAGKVVAFGQCAMGLNTLSAKLNELDGFKFARKWFQQGLVVEPMRFFFVPRNVAEEAWENTGIDGGVVFDRCRIVSCLRDLDGDLLARCKKTTKELLRDLRQDA
jgi:hypothetical protein